MPDSAEWFFVKNGQKHGPFAEGDLIRELVTLANPRDTLIWAAELKEWVAASTVSALAARLPPPIPQVETSAAESARLGSQRSSNAPPVQPLGDVTNAGRKPTHADAQIKHVDKIA